MDFNSSMRNPVRLEFWLIRDFRSRVTCDFAYILRECGISWYGDASFIFDAITRVESLMGTPEPTHRSCAGYNLLKIYKYFRFIRKTRGDRRLHFAIPYCTWGKLCFAREWLMRTNTRASINICEHTLAESCCFSIIRTCYTLNRSRVHGKIILTAFGSERNVIPAYSELIEKERSLLKEIY